jgi:hypothetical protein
MPSKLSTTISKIATIPNPVNSMLISEFHKYIETSGASERHQNNSLKMVIAFAFFIGKDVTFYNIRSKDQICSFLDTKIKSQEEDPDKDGLPLGIIIWCTSSDFLDGYITTMNLNVVATNNKMMMIIIHPNHNG